MQTIETCFLGPETQNLYISPSESYQGGDRNFRSRKDGLSTERDPRNSGFNVEEQNRKNNQNFPVNRSGINSNRNSDYDLNIDGAPSEQMNDLSPKRKPMQGESVTPASSRPTLTNIPSPKSPTSPALNLESDSEEDIPTEPEPLTPLHISEDEETGDIASIFKKCKTKPPSDENKPDNITSAKSKESILSDKVEKTSNETADKSKTPFALERERPRPPSSDRDRERERGRHYPHRDDRGRPPPPGERGRPPSGDRTDRDRDRERRRLPPMQGERGRPHGPPGRGREPPNHEKPRGPPNRPPPGDISNNERFKERNLPNKPPPGLLNNDRFRAQKNPSIATDKSLKQAAPTGQDIKTDKPNLPLNTSNSADGKSTFSNSGSVGNDDDDSSSSTTTEGCDSPNTAWKNAQFEMSDHAPTPTPEQNKAQAENKPPEVTKPTGISPANFFSMFPKMENRNPGSQSNKNTNNLPPEVGRNKLKDKFSIAI